jgi:hypothetical protein
MDLSLSPSLSRLGCSQPTIEVQARLALLEEEVMAAERLDGIRLQEALSLLHSRLGQRIRAATLRYTLAKWQTWHKLSVWDGRVRLRGDVVVEILRERRAREFSRQVVAGEVELVGKAD